MSGDGSIFRLASGQWRAQLSIGPRSDRRYVTRTRGTRREARAALDELKADHRSGIAPARRSLGDFLRSWLAETVIPSVSPNTARGYEDAIVHWQPIHHIALADLRAEHIERCANRMTATKGKTTKPAAPKTVRNAQLMLRAALEVAHQRGDVRRNEARLVPLRRVPRVRRLAMTRELAQSVLAAVERDRYEAVFALALSALRVSEILGLSRADVDLKAGTVTVRQQLAGSGPRAKLAQAKTAASEQTIDLPAFALARLTSHLERDRRPVHDLDGALVFVTERGYAVNGSWLTKHFQALLAAAGLPKLTIHDLRAGAASLLAAEGAHPSLARDFLRHANVSTTLTHYTRTTVEQRRQTAALLDAAIRSVTESVTEAVE